MTTHIRPLAEIDKQLCRYAIAFTLAIAAVVGMLLSGCVHEIKFVPQCAGSPAVSYPCIAPCKVKVYATVPTEELIPNAFVMKDHTGVVRCSKEVS